MVCAICLHSLLDLDGDENPTSGLLCSHVFHTNCLNNWELQGRHTCPECRAPIVRHAINADFTQDVQLIHQLQHQNQELQQQNQELAGQNQGLEQQVQQLQAQRLNVMQRFEIQRGLVLVQRAFGRVRFQLDNAGMQEVRVRYTRPYVYLRGRRTFLAFELA